MRTVCLNVMGYLSPMWKTILTTSIAKYNLMLKNFSNNMKSMNISVIKLHFTGVWLNNMNNEFYYWISIQPSNTETIFSLLDCTLIHQFLTKSPKIKAQNLKTELVQLEETWVSWQVIRGFLLYTCNKLIFNLRRFFNHISGWIGLCCLQNDIWFSQIEAHQNQTLIKPKYAQHKYYHCESNFEKRKGIFLWWKIKFKAVI